MFSSTAAAVLAALSLLQGGFAKAEEGSAEATLADCQVNHACETDPNNCATATFRTCSKDEDWDQANNVGQMPGVGTGKLMNATARPT